MADNWLLDAAQRFRQRVEVASPLPDPEIDPEAIVETLRLEIAGPSPDRRTYPCIGCGKPQKAKHAYCRTCRDRVEDGVDVEIGDVPTERECRRVCGWGRGKRKRINHYAGKGTNG